MDLDRLCLALHLGWIEWKHLDAAAKHPRSRPGEEDDPRLGHGLEARGRVEHVSGDSSLAPGVVIGEGLAGVDRDLHAYPDIRIHDLAVELIRGLAHLQRCPHRAERVILVCGRHAERAHDRVADELLDRPTVVLDRGAHRAEVPVQQLAEDLGVEALAELGRADEITEERRDEASPGFTGR